MAFLRKKHNTWYAVISLPGGERIDRSTKQKDKGTPAERAEALRRAKSIAAAYEDSARGNVVEGQIRRTIADLFQRVNGRRLEFAVTAAYLRTWLDRVKQQKAANTWVRYDVIVRRFLKHLGPKASASLGDITPQEVQSFLDAELAGGARPTSVRLSSKTINTPFARALREGLILTNPVQAIELPQGASVGRLPFSLEQVKRLFAAARGDWKTAILLGAFTGARLSDCANMHRSAVDLEARVIRFKPAKTRASGKEVVMPIHPVLLEHLKALPNARAVRGATGCPSVSGEDDDPRVIIPAVDPAAISPWLCPTLAGRPVGGRVGLSLEFKSVMQAAGVADPERSDGLPKEPTRGPGSQRRVPLLSFHSLRHTFVSLLADAGVAPDLRQALAGHSSERMSERYTHRGFKLLQSAIDKLPTLPAIEAPAELAQPQNQTQNDHA